jgi:hypothetical protein
MSNYSPQEFRLIQDEINNLFNSNSTWKSVGFRHKITNGQDTGDVAITLLTKEKLPLDQIDSNDVFPESIIIPGLSEPVKTDVQVADTDNIPIAQCHETVFDIDDESSWVMPCSGHRVEHRPLKGGLSCSSFPNDGYGDGSVYPSPGWSMPIGTLGGLCIDLDDNTVVGVSNNHVLGGHQVRGDTLPTSAYCNQYGLTYWSILSSIETTSTALNETRYSVYQRSSGDEGNGSNNPPLSQPKTQLDLLKVGTTKRAYPFTSTNNKLDVAIFALDTTVSDLFSTTESWKQYLLARQDEDMVGTYQGLSAMDFATTDEINSLAAGGGNEYAPVFRSGRTNGPVGWPGSKLYGTSTCWLSAYDVTGAHNVNYGDNLGSIGFVESIYLSGGVIAATGGDSGSFVYALFNEGNPTLSAWKVIGILFAASGSGNVAKANRIDNVASMFNLSAYRGEDLDIGYKNYDMKVVDSRQSAVTAMIAGKLYWQAGSTNSPATGRFDT